MKEIYELSIFLFSTYLLSKAFWYLIQKFQYFDDRHRNNFTVIALFVFFLIGGLVFCTILSTILISSLLV